MAAIIIVKHPEGLCKQHCKKCLSHYNIYGYHGACCDGHTCLKK